VDPRTLVYGRRALIRVIGNRPCSASLGVVPASESESLLSVAAGSGTASSSLTHAATGGGSRRFTAIHGDLLVDSRDSDRGALQTSDRVCAAVCLWRASEQRASGPVRVLGLAAVATARWDSEQREQNALTRWTR
jgi:hypothetical protein